MDILSKARNYCPFPVALWFLGSLQKRVCAFGIKCRLDQSHFCSAPAGGSQLRRAGTDLKGWALLVTTASCSFMQETTMGAIGRTTPHLLPANPPTGWHYLCILWMPKRPAEFLHHFDVFLL